MKKSQLLKHLKQVAERASERKRLNGIHVRTIVEELQDVWAKSLQETGTASLKGFGRFDVHKGTGSIKFTPSKLWKDKIAGDVSSSVTHSDSDSEDEDDDRISR